MDKPVCNFIDSSSYEEKKSLKIMTPEAFEAAATAVISHMSWKHNRKFNFKIFNRHNETGPQGNLKPVSYKYKKRVVVQNKLNVLLKIFC